MLFGNNDYMIKKNMGKVKFNKKFLILFFLLFVGILVYIFTLPKRTKIESLGNLDVAISRGWKLVNLNMISGAIETDDSHNPGVVQVGKEPTGDVIKKEVASYIRFEEIENDKNYLSIDEWLARSDGSGLAPLGAQKVDVPNELFSRKALNEPVLSNDWREVTVFNFPQGEKKGKYVAYAAMVKGKIVVATIYVNPDYPAIDSMTEILNSLVYLNK